MRFTLTFKDPDMYIGDLADVMYDKTGEDYYDFISQWTGGEYITVQFDTVAKTCVVLKDGEEGINDHWDKDRDVVARVDFARFGDETTELKRQLDEAVETLANEQDKSTPYAQGLLKFIIDTREQIKFHETPLDEIEKDYIPSPGIEPKDVEG